MAWAYTWNTLWYSLVIVEAFCSADKCTPCSCFPWGSARLCLNWSRYLLAKFWNAISEFHQHAQKVRARTKARLSFSGGPHAPVNMADSMENAGSWTVSGSKEAMKVPRTTSYVFPPPTFTSSILSAIFTGTCGPPEKLSLALVPRSHVLRMIVKLAYSEMFGSRTDGRAFQAWRNRSLGYFESILLQLTSACTWCHVKKPSPNAADYRKRTYV